MWHTEQGDRVLRGAEAKLFAEGLLDLIEFELSADGDFRSGIPVFDSLTYPQKIAVLHQVANALLLETVPMPELTAVLEGAVATVIQSVRWLVEEEVEGVTGGDRSLRRLVSRACRDLGVDHVPSLSAASFDDWAFCVDCLHNAILWDIDYLGEDVFVDLPPERAKAIKEEMGVADGYFLSVAPDPKADHVSAMLADLEALCHEVMVSGKPGTSVRSSRKRRPRGTQP